MENGDIFVSSGLPVVILMFCLPTDRVADLPILHPPVVVPSPHCYISYREFELGYADIESSVSYFIKMQYVIGSLNQLK